jgi:hypothetical protein
MQQFYGMEGQQSSSGWEEVPPPPTEPHGQFFETEEYSYEAGESSMRTPKAKPWVEVKVTVDKHLVRPTEWVFTVGTDVKKVEKDKWEQAPHNGKRVWAYHG